MELESSMNEIIVYLDHISKTKYINPTEIQNNRRKVVHVVEFYKHESRLKKSVKMDLEELLKKTNHGEKVTSEQLVNIINKLGV